MPTYVLMTKLGPDESEDARSRRERGQAWKKKVEHLCPGIRWLTHYALLGPYDFMDIYEAPDEQTAFKVSMLSRAEGAIAAESWPAVPYDDFLALNDAVASEHAKKKR
jgi:uncharacterized protein with GYD domain